VPNIEACANARNIESVRLFDRRLVGVVFYLDGIEHPTDVIDEMYLISGH